MLSISGVSSLSARLFSRLLQHEEEIGANHRFPPVEVKDATHQYTSDEAHVIEERRGISEEPVAEAIDKVSRHMVQRKFCVAIEQLINNDPLFAKLL